MCVFVEVSAAEKGRLRIKDCLQTMKLRVKWSVINDLCNL